MNLFRIQDTGFWIKGYRIVDTAQYYEIAAMDFQPGNIL
jgi:hypothetical protein